MNQPNKTLQITDNVIILCLIKIKLLNKKKDNIQLAKLKQVKMEEVKYSIMKMLKQLGKKENQREHYVLNLKMQLQSNIINSSH